MPSSTLESLIRVAHKKLCEAGIPTDVDVSMRQYSWFKTGGTARLLLKPQSITQLSLVARLLTRLALPYKVIGETTNLLFLDDVHYSCLVCTTHIRNIDFDPERRFLIADCGVMLSDLSRHALSLELKGFTGLEGIPGTVGGAVFMNAGAYGSDMHQVVEKVEVVMPNGSIQTLPVSALGFKYRDSVFKSGKNLGKVCRVFFRAEPGNKEQLYAHMETVHALRHRHYEYMYPNLGSLFAGTLYRSLGKKDRLFACAASLYYLFNFRLRFNKRETPLNRKWLNSLAVKRFNISYVKQPFSDKSLNVLINDNHHTDELLLYINQIKDLLGDDISIENEIVNSF